MGKERTASLRESVLKTAVPINLRSLWMRRNREFLWISRKNKRIYLSERNGCLALYFPSDQDMLDYIGRLSQMGYVIDEK